MNKKHYCAVLGVSPHASKQEIKATYYKLALQYHPDRNHNCPFAEEKFKAIAQAYEMLTDESKYRAHENDNLYDSTGKRQFTTTEKMVNVLILLIAIIAALMLKIYSHYFYDTIIYYKKPIILTIVGSLILSYLAKDRVKIVFTSERLSFFRLRCFIVTFFSLSCALYLEHNPRARSMNVGPIFSYSSKPTILSGSLPKNLPMPSSHRKA